MDGIEATKKIRNSVREDNDVPIFAMTANTFATDRKRCADAGMTRVYSETGELKRDSDDAGRESADGMRRITGRINNRKIWRRGSTALDCSGAFLWCIIGSKRKQGRITEWKLQKISHGPRNWKGWMCFFRRGSSSCCFRVSGTGRRKEIWLVYLMNDAAESFLVFHDAELTGTYQKEYEGEIDAALEKDGEQYVLIVRQKETVCTLFFSRLSLEVHLFDYGKTGHFWVDGYEYLRQIEFRIAILRDKLEYLGEAFCTEEEMRLASLANFPPLNFCCYPAVPDQYLVPSCPWWEATEEAITEMKKLASEAGDKVLLRYLALYEKWQGKLLAKQIAKLLHTSRHAKVVDLLEKLAREAQNYPKRRFTGEEGTQIRKIQEQAMKRKKILEAEGKRASLLREEPFFYARDSVEYKVHLMIWGTRGKERVVEVETFKISRTQRQ